MERNSVDPARSSLPVFVQQGGKDVIVALAVKGVRRPLVPPKCSTDFIVTTGGDHVSAAGSPPPMP